MTIKPRSLIFDSPAVSSKGFYRLASARRDDHEICLQQQIGRPVAISAGLLGTS